MRSIVPTIALSLVAACGQPRDPETPLEALLESIPERFDAVLDEPARYRLQIIYTQIDRDADNRPSFRSMAYRAGIGEYFYPASTVKLPVAALALEKLNRLDVPRLDRDTVMLTGKDADFHTEATLDPTSETGFPSVAHYLRKIFLVSDNDAFNRLYEFLGQRALNEAMRDKGYDGTRIVHRLSIPLTPEQNAWTNPVSFRSADEIVHRQPAVRDTADFLGEDPQLLGEAEIIDGQRVAGPKDFAVKNAYPLQALHDTVRSIMFPDSMPPQRRFELTAEDYRLLRTYMSMYPDESGIEAYANRGSYPQGFVKFLMYGGKADDIPDKIRIFNKVGDAYGFLTDAAYIVDFEAGIEFMLAATIYTNANATFNDGEYEYEELGLPFLRDLGLLVYRRELQRPREHAPDLSGLRALHREDSGTAGGSGTRSPVPATPANR